MSDVGAGFVSNLVGVAMNHTGEHHTGIHVLNGATKYQTWLTQRETPLGETNPSEWQWTMGDVNHYAIPKVDDGAMNPTEKPTTGLHVLIGAQEEQTGVPPTACSFGR